jgi:hypothetical protein
MIPYSMCVSGVCVCVCVCVCSGRCHACPGLLREWGPLVGHAARLACNIAAHPQSGAEVPELERNRFTGNH